jgi:hypothetical protein
MDARNCCAALFLMTAGCSAGGSATPPTAQTEFDLTVDADRALFQEQGLAFAGSVGPFAVYRVTAAEPALLGPNVAPETHVGYAMLCGATKYFTPLGAAAPTAFMKLHGGADGNLPLVETDQEAASEGECAPPKDTFGNPLPDGGQTPPGGPDDLGPTTPPVFNPPGDGADLSLVFNSPEQPVVQSLHVKFNPAPNVGSTVLIRRVALTGARQHNGSHVIPSICCKSDSSCALAPLQ